MLEAVRQDGLALESTVFCADRGVVLAAVRRAVAALQFAAGAPQRDRELVLAAVRPDGGALEFASGAFQADREVALTAVQQSGRAWFPVLAPLNADREVVLAVVRQSGSVFRHLPVLRDGRRWRLRRCSKAVAL